jgi:hypothetical protein
MPQASYIDPTAVPAQAVPRGVRSGVARAMELLQGAQASNKALRLEMGPEDQGGTWYYRLKTAAKKMQLRIDISYEYLAVPGLIKPQARVIYVTIVGSETPPLVLPKHPVGLNIQMPADRRVIDAVGAEVSR